MFKMNKKQKYLRTETIQQVLLGDEDAVMELFEVYNNYINHFCKKTLYDMNGNVHTYIDEDMSQFIKMYILKYVKNFKLDL